MVLFMFLVSGMASAQSPNKFSYQSIIRAIGGQALTNQSIGIRLSILQGSDNGTAVYVETHTATTSGQGLVTLQMGGGNVQSGTIAQIDWANGPYFVKNEIDPEGGSSYSISGTTPLLSVPYSLFSANGMEKGTQAGQMMYWNGSDWILIAPGSTGQTLTMCNGVPTWGACPPSLPILTTNSIQSVTSSSAISGGNITSNGGGTITARGVCWSTSPNPTVALSTKTVDGTGIGSFSSTVFGLVPNTTYHLRAYATNQAGTAYGNAVVFSSTVGNQVSDIDGNIYQTVLIGTQEWMNSNLKVKRFSDGSPITEIQGQQEWEATYNNGLPFQTAWCYYNNDSTYNNIYGKLYNWLSVADSKGLCPIGWHVPNDNEWTILRTYLGSSASGGKMKTVGTIQAGTGNWNQPNTGATNESGFFAQPGGNRNNAGFFGQMGYYSFFWSSSEGFTSSVANVVSLGFDYSFSSLGNDARTYGFSVRCIKN
jgi:uncharacterized protein (TIGR02145 family)